jgi:branched-chain amino acid transport system substrate-binding protein
VRFDEKGQNTGIRAIMQQIQKGAYATIWPFDLAAAEVIYPLPGYKEKK